MKRALRPASSPMQDMTRIEGGTFAMGSERFYPEEAPVRRVRVNSFWIDPHPVTNREFARFVSDTNYRTFAETAPDPKDYPGMLADMAQPGSLVFEQTPGPVDLGDFRQWWFFRLGANWRHPTGPDSSIDGREDHPVVHISYGDAEAYAKWAGKALPTEAEWEFAARGGIDGADYAWGNEFEPEGSALANYWHGSFPYSNEAPDGYERTSPVGSFPANGYGLSDMIGNVWEWTADWYSLPKTEGKKSKGSCCVPSNPRGAKQFESYDPCTPQVRIGRKVLKGGSHLCAPNYCRRYRPAARHAQAIDSSTSHIGFRCVARERH